MTKLKLKAGSRPPWPWVGLAAAVWVQISAGNGSNFPLYSSLLKSVMGFNQQQLRFLGECWTHHGIACNRFPPWAVLLLACFLGYAVTQTVHALPYWLLWMALLIGSNSNARFGTAVLVTNMRNFPLSRGTISGILKGYSRISAAVFTVFYCFLLQRSASKLLMFLTLGIPVICLVMMYFIRPCTPPSGEDSSVHVHFVFTQVASVLLAIYLITITVTYDTFPLSDAVSYVLLAIVFIFLLAPVDFNLGE